MTRALVRVAYLSKYVHRYILDLSIKYEHKNLHINASYAISWLLWEMLIRDDIEDSHMLFHLL